MSARRIQVARETRGEAVAEAARILRGGGIAFLPAEGVYGLHARADLPDAVTRLASLKPREAGRGWIALVADPGELDRWARGPDPAARALASRHWPGPLTLVVPAAPGVPAAVLGPGNTVALRCPGNPLLHEIVALSGGPVVSTSANEPGEPPAVTAAHPLADRADLVLDAGPLPGTPSTVVAVRDGAVQVLREGAVRVSQDPAEGSDGAPL